MTDWEAVYQQMLTDPRHSEIIEHLPTLRQYASGCLSVVELGVHDASTSFAMMMGRPENLLSIDIQRTPWFVDLESAASDLYVNFEFREQDSREQNWQVCDLLFIDSFHAGMHLTGELAAHGQRVRQYIIMHDTEIFGRIGEDGSEGLWMAIGNFLKVNENWRLTWHHPNNNGLTCLTRV